MAAESDHLTVPADTEGVVGPYYPAGPRYWPTTVEAGMDAGRREMDAVPCDDPVRARKGDLGSRTRSDGGPRALSTPGLPVSDLRGGRR